MKHPKYNRLNHRNGHWTIKKSKAKRVKLQVVAREALMRDDPEEWCVLLGMLGLSGKFIAYEVGVSVHMVYYYMSRRGVKLAQYRNGESKLAQAVIKYTATLPVRQSVRLNMGEQKLLLPR